MVLDAIDRFSFVGHAFDSLVVEVDAIDRNVAGQTFGIDREAMVLRGDFDFAGFEILDRLVGAAMAEL